MPCFQQLDNCNARAPTCKLSRSRSTPRSRWRKSAWQARPQPTHRNYCTSTYFALVVFKAVFQLFMESWTEQNIRRRPTSMICLCRSASSAYDLEDVFAQQDQNRSEKKKLQKAWIPCDLSQNHPPQPGPSKTVCNIFQSSKVRRHTLKLLGSDTVSVQQNLVLLSTNGCALAAQAAQVATFFSGAQGPNRRCSQAKQRHLKNTNGTCK